MASTTPPAGRLEAIWIKRAHGGPMDGLEHATLRTDTGIIGNADRGGLRQVTLIEREAWEAVRQELGSEVAFTARRANLLVSGVALEDSRDRILCVGHCRLRIGGETTPCGRMDEEHPGLQAALVPHWRAGAFGTVLNDGDIHVGDAVRWDDDH